MEQATILSVDQDQILSEVINELSSGEEIGEVLAVDENQIRHLRPILAYACRLHLRAGCTVESRTALKRFVRCYLRGEIPHFENY
ncbi:MAG: hypothetical protein ACFFDP_11750 [Promethearchaeota archaeon]